MGKRSRSRLEACRHARLGRKSFQDHHGDWMSDDAYVAEASVKRGPWTGFARAEEPRPRMLELEDEDHGPAFKVGKLSAGAIQDFPVSKHRALGVGGLVASTFVPNGLRSE